MAAGVVKHNIYYVVTLCELPLAPLFAPVSTIVARPVEIFKRPGGPPTSLPLFPPCRGVLFSWPRERRNRNPKRGAAPPSQAARAVRFKHKQPPVYERFLLYPRVPPPRS